MERWWIVRRSMEAIREPWVPWPPPGADPGQRPRTLEDAVYRLTGMPSEVYGLPMIGKLKEGLNADITVFDYKNVRANADYDHPFRKNNGIEYVIVNGKTAVKNGEFTGVKNGKVLRMKRER